MPRETVLRPKGKLTAAWLDRLKIEDRKLFEGREPIAEDVGRVTVKDTDVRGLELRMSSSGARAWAVSRRLDGIQRRFTLPNSSMLTLAEARARRGRAQCRREPRPRPDRGPARGPQGRPDGAARHRPDLDD